MEELAGMPFCSVIIWGIDLFLLSFSATSARYSFLILSLLCILGQLSMQWQCSRSSPCCAKHIGKVSIANPDLNSGTVISRYFASAVRPSRNNKCGSHGYHMGKFHS